MTIWTDPAAMAAELNDLKSDIVVSDTAITVKHRKGNNHLKPEREAEAVRLFMEGHAIRKIRAETGIASKTLQRIRRGLTLPDCACGEPAGHRGWCKPRFDASPARHKIIGRITKKIVFDAKLFNRWKKTMYRSNMIGANDSGLREGILLLAAFHHDTFNEAKLQRATGFDTEFITTRCFNLRNNGVWLNGKWSVDSDFDPKNSAMLNVQFALWILVATGEVVKVKSA